MNDDRRAAERTCAVTRTVHSADELIRFVRAPDGGVVPDLKRRLPGRGVWIEARRASVAEAVKRKVFARGFKDKAEAAPDLADQVDLLIERAALEMLSLANKAGKVVTGFGKVEGALKSGVAALLHASDGAEDGKRKLAQAARRSGREEPALVGVFSSGQLDLALGRENVVHAALLPDPVSDAFLARVSQLARYRQTPGNVPAQDLAEQE